MRRATTGAPDAQLPLDLPAARAEVAALRRVEAEADAAYHGADAPLMGDAEYDALVRRDDAIVAAFPGAEDAPRPIGAAPSAAFRAVPHLSPMLSLDNAWTLGDIEAFVERVTAALAPHGRVPEFSVEQKIDGLSMSLVYRDRVLRSGLTRGDGTEGEDVSANARTVTGIPHWLAGDVPDLVEVRGEAYMLRGDFPAANARRQRMGKDPFSNLRNAAAGSLRHHDPEETRARKLVFAAYGIGKASAPVAAREDDLLPRLAAMGFATAWIGPQCGTAAEVWAEFERMGTARAGLDHDIDGMVVKVSSLADRELLGFTGRSPRWAIALKFAAERATTVLEALDVQVGRSGTLTPVARLAPVKVGGVTVTNATLHNQDHVDRLGLRVGDVVELERAGDVIPKIIGRVSGGAGTRWMMPTACPACGAAAVRDAGRSATSCSNAMSCPASALARFEHACGREVFDIDGLGGGKLETLLPTGLLRQPADLWRLAAHRDAVRRLPGWGDVSTDNLLASIERRRKLPLHRVLTSLSIREVGRTASRALAARYKTMAAARAAMQAAATDASALADLESIDGMGPVMAGEVAKWFSEPRNTAALDELMGEIEVEAVIKTAVPAGSGLAGKTVVFTGTLVAGKRGDAEDRARRLGAVATGSVSAKTDIVVFGDSPGSKLEKARGLNAKAAAAGCATPPIAIMTEDEWEALVSRGAN